MTATGSANSKAIKVGECDGSKAQSWKLRPSSGNYFQIVSGLKDGVCLDLPGSSGKKGLKAQTYSCRLGRDNMEYKWQEPIVNM